MWDKALILSEDQDLSQAVGSYYSTELDLGAANMGEGTPIYLHVRVDEAFDSSGGTATLAVTLQSATASGGSFVDSVVQTDAIAEATLVSGYRIMQVALPAGLSQYIKIKYDIAGETTTAGTVNAWLDLGQDTTVD